MKTEILTKNHKYQDIEFERIYLNVDNETIAFYQPSLNCFWLGLNDKMPYNGKPFIKLKKYRELTAEFLKNEMEKRNYIYMSWLKPDEQKNFHGYFHSDPISINQILPYF